MKPEPDLGINRVFPGSFTEQEPIPEAGIAAAVVAMRSGRLHRYTVADQEAGQVAALEAEYAVWQGARFCLALASGGQAMQIALRAAGVAPGDRVLTNAFTLAPVPGAIAAIGARADLVECDDTLCLDLEDLAGKIAKAPVKALLLSHMRGHLCDMDAVSEICARAGVTLIEDCAHTMGARWHGRLSGAFGRVACFSTQSYKHINSGEGGFLTTDDPRIMARSTILSGSYMNYRRHGAGPEDVAFADARLEMPNCSARMDAVRAAILRPQLATLDANIDRWAARHDRLRDRLAAAPGIALPKARPEARRVGSSIQFRLPDATFGQCDALVDACAARGVELKWFGRPDPRGFTSAHASWGYLTRQSLPQTDRVLSTLFDMRIPLTFALEDFDVIGCIIVDEIASIRSES